MDDIRHSIPEKPTRFLDLLRQHIRNSGLAYRTEQTYLHWTKRYIYFHNKQHPKLLGPQHIEAFLNHLTARSCSVSTQRVALNALVYVYRRFLGLDIGGQCVKRTFTNLRGHIAFVTASLHTFLKTAMICAPFKSYWVTPILRPPKSIPTLSIVGAKAC